jgi:general secretion pathway protein H
MSATGNREPVPEGFTLLEMLVVMAILALIAGIGFPAIERAISTQRTRLATTEVVAALGDARALAVATGQVTPFRIAENGSAFRIGARNPSALPEGFRLTADQQLLRFFDDGTSDEGRMTLVGNQSRILIRVDPESGIAAVSNARP